LDVDSFSTHSDGAEEQLQKKGEDHFSGNNAEIDYQSMPAVESGLHKEIHLRTHPWRQSSIECLLHQR
jgi:hypothetical protein